MHYAFAVQVLNGTQGLKHNVPCDCFTKVSSGNYAVEQFATLWNGCEIVSGLTKHWCSTHLRELHDNM